MKYTLILLLIFTINYFGFSQTTQRDIFVAGGGLSSNISYSNFATFGQAFAQQTSSSSNTNNEGFIYAQDKPADILFVSQDYTPSNTIWGYNYFNDINLAILNSTSNATINVTNYSHIGNVDLKNRKVIVGVSDFEFTGDITGGLVQVNHSGRLIMKNLQANTTKTFPITDSQHNYTLTFTTSNTSNPDISIKLSNYSVAGAMSPNFWDIDGPPNLDATITFRVDKAAIAPKRLNSHSQLRYKDNNDIYKPVQDNNFSISDEGSYYLITLTNVNKY